MKLLIGIENSLKYFWAKTKHLNYYMILKKLILKQIRLCYCCISYLKATLSIQCILVYKIEYDVIDFMEISRSHQDAEPSFSSPRPPGSMFPPPSAMSGKV